MLLIPLLIAIIIQFSAAFVAIKLIRTTKYNASWILITIALTLQCVLMLSQFLGALQHFIQVPFTIKFTNEISVIITVITSSCFAVGVFLIKKILNYIYLKEKRRRQNNERTLNAIIEAEENERQRFAKELHDGLGPLLSAAKLSVSALATRTEDKFSQELISNIEQAVNLSIKSVKEISSNMTPHVLNSFGLEVALNGFMNRMRPASQTKIMFETNIKDRRFEPKAELIIYRVVCELTNNVIKHANAKLLIVNIEYTGSGLNISVQDDGVGFDVEQTSQGMGLSNITSRIGSIKGNIDIHSSSASGTHIKISLPVRQIKK